jgi:hypothetical protein
MMLRCYVNVESCEQLAYGFCPPTRVTPNPTGITGAGVGVYGSWMRRQLIDTETEADDKSSQYLYIVFK